MKPLYAVSMELDAQQPVNRILGELHTWLSQKEGPFALETLMRSGRFALERGGRLDVAIASRIGQEAGPYLHAIRYSHPDQAIAGRRWVTELGLSANDGEPWIKASVVLAYEDLVRTEVAAPNATRPLLVPRLAKRCKANPEREGQQFESVDAGSLPKLRSWLRSTSRRLPAVIVAQTHRGDSLVDLGELRWRLEGIATVVCPTPELEGPQLIDELGERIAPWAGAVKVIYPLPDSPYADPGEPRVTVVRPRTIEGWRLSGQSAEVRIFEIVASRSIWGALRAHVSVEAVHEVRIARYVQRSLQARTDHLRIDAAAGLAELRERILELELELSEASETVTALSVDLRDARADADHYCQVADDEENARRVAEEKASALEAQLNRSTAKDAGVETVVAASDLAESLGRFLRDEHSVEDVLRLVTVAFPERIVVLESAMSSARDSSGFRHVNRARALLGKLAGPYWEQLASGSPDSVSRGVFGRNEYAADEANLTKAGRRRRTFQYLGEQVEMFAHLKIGGKESDAETLRIHFRWNAAAKCIVIGYCGPHLDF
jgi:hypothetical protein